MRDYCDRLFSRKIVILYGESISGDQNSVRKSDISPLLLTIGIKGRTMSSCGHLQCAVSLIRGFEKRASFLDISGSERVFAITAPNG